MMKENIRVLFSALWILASACLFASGLAMLVTLGGYLDLFLYSLAAWCIATLGTIIASL